MCSTGFARQSGIAAFSQGALGLRHGALPILHSPHQQVWVLLGTQAGTLNLHELGCATESQDMTAFNSRGTGRLTT